MFISVPLFLISARPNPNGDTFSKIFSVFAKASSKLSEFLDKIMVSSIVSKFKSSNFTFDNADVNVSDCSKFFPETSAPVINTLLLPSLRFSSTFCFPVVFFRPAY